MKRSLITSAVILNLHENKRDLEATRGGKSEGQTQALTYLSLCMLQVNKAFPASTNT